MVACLLLLMLLYLRKLLFVCQGERAYDTS
jgi:hypothetical protein